MEWNGGMEHIGMGHWNDSSNTNISQHHFPLSIYESYIMQQLHKSDLLYPISVLLLDLVYV